MNRHPPQQKGGPLVGLDQGFRPNPAKQALRSASWVIVAVPLVACHHPSTRIPTIAEINKANGFFTDLPSTNGPQVGDIYFIKFGNSGPEPNVVEQGCRPEASVATS